MHFKIENGEEFIYFVGFLKLLSAHHKGAEKKVNFDILLYWVAVIHFFSFLYKYCSISHRIDVQIFVDLSAIVYEYEMSKKRIFNLLEKKEVFSVYAAL